jgi:hypothetical protein
LPMLRCTLAVAIMLSTIQIAAMADGYDGSQPLYGTSERIIKINKHTIIDGVDPNTVGVPTKFRIDFKTNTLQPSKDSLVRKVVSFNRIDHMENLLVIQGLDSGIEGVDDGLAWSLTISKLDGKAVLTATGDGVAYVVFGAFSTLAQVQ